MSGGEVELGSGVTSRSTRSVGQPPGQRLARKNSDDEEETAEAKLVTTNSNAKPATTDGSAMPLQAWFETAAVVASWFVLNIAMGSSTKWIFLYGKICFESASNDDCHQFNFPFAITVIHMIFSWAMCWFQLRYVRVRHKGVSLTIQQQFYRVAPLAAVFSMSVAMGNLSLKYIFPSFNQMLGSMSPLITVALSVCMQRKRYNMWTWISMPIICGGLAMCSMKELNFHWLGALYATGATVLRALKSIMQGRLLQGDNLDSVTLLFYMAPWAAGLLMVLGAFTEGIEPFLLLSKSLGVRAEWHGLEHPGLPVTPAPHSTGGPYVLMLLFVSGLNACLLNVANFLVTAYTNAVTLQVLGNVKSCLSIAVSVAIFRNSLTVEQAIGVVACLFGVWVYNDKGGPAKAPIVQDEKKQVELEPIVVGRPINGKV